MNRQPEGRKTKAGAQRIVPPTERTSEPAARKKPAAQKSGPREKPVAPSRHGGAKPPVKRTRTSAHAQAVGLRNAMRSGDGRGFGRQVSRVFRLGPARTARVMKKLAQTDRPVLDSLITEVAKNSEWALKVASELQRRDMRHCSLAVLLITVERRPRDLPLVLGRLREEGRVEDVSVFLAAAARLSDETSAVLADALDAAGLPQDSDARGPAPARPSEEVPSSVVEEALRVLTYTSLKGPAEQELRGIRISKRRQRQRESRTTTAARSEEGPRHRLLRRLISLFTRRRT